MQSPTPNSSPIGNYKITKRMWAIILSICLALALMITFWTISKTNSTKLAQAHLNWELAVENDNQTLKIANDTKDNASNIHSQSNDRVKDDTVRLELEENTTELIVLYDSTIKIPNTGNRAELEHATAALNQRTFAAQSLITEVETDTATVQEAMDDYLLADARDKNLEARRTETALIAEARAAIKDYEGKIATSTTDGKRQNILETLAKEIESAERNLNVPVDRDSNTDLNLNTPTLSNPLLRPYLQDAHRSHEKWKEQQAQQR